MRIWLISPKPCSLLSNTKMLQTYIQRVLNRSFKAICISGIIYLQITLLRMNYLKGFCQMHSITRLIRLRRLSLLDCLQLCHDHNDQNDFATRCRHLECNSRQIVIVFVLTYTEQLHQKCSSAWIYLSIGRYTHSIHTCNKEYDQYCSSCG